MLRHANFTALASIVPENWGDIYVLRVKLVKSVKTSEKVLKVTA